MFSPFYAAECVDWAAEKVGIGCEVENVVVFDRAMQEAFYAKNYEDTGNSVLSNHVEGICGIQYWSAVF